MTEHNRRIRNYCAILIAAAALLLCISCNTRNDNIIVAEDGTSTITVELKGHCELFDPPIALPSEPEWTILDVRRDSPDDEDPELEIKAEMVVPYGEPLPDTFAADESNSNGVNLRFPSSVRLWRDGNRTFYEFRRTYKARRFRCIDLTADTDDWDSALEDRVMQKGIFEVSDEDRAKYLDQCVLAFSYKRWRILWDALGRLVADSRLTIAERDSIEIPARNLLEAVVTPQRLQEMLSWPDDSLYYAYRDFEQHIRRELEQIVSRQVPHRLDEVLTAFGEAYDHYQTEYDVTERLALHTFHVALNLPGAIIETNGFVEPETPHSVSWWFEGEGLLDRDIPLYALSVVEH